jgi:VWFA-related protein
MKTRSFASLMLAAAVALCPVPAPAQQQPQAGEAEVQLRGEEVLLDLVAVDNRGRPVLDLRADEVEVYEDGQRQEVTSFSIMRAGSPAGDPAPAGGSMPAALANSPFRHFNLILVVVDRTSVRTTNLQQTYKAAERFIGERLTPRDLVAVFAAGRSLALVQNFTNDKALLLEAMRRATQSAEPLVEQLGDTASSRVKISEFDDQTAPFLLIWNEIQPLSRQLNDLARFVDVTLNELRQQVQARAILYDLLALTKVYSRVPGRKSVLFYSEGFAVDAITESVFSSAIAAANRSNFVFYTVDAAGLRTGLDVRPTTEELSRPPSGIEGDRTIVVGGNSGLGRVEKALLSNNDAPLDRLAVETGGMSLRNSNDLSRGFEAVENDLRSYYALSYAAANPKADGTYRSISVKVTRKDVEVRTRKGYYAVPGGDAVLLPFEQPLLAMLAGRSPQNSGPKVALATERFRGEGGWLVPVTLIVDAGSLTPVEQPPDENAKKDAAPGLKLQVDTVALVVDARGSVVARLSRPTSYRVPKERAGGLAGQGLAIPPFRPGLLLPPGRYTLRVGAYDPASRKGTILERAIRLPELPDGGAPAVSSLVLSRATEAVADADREAATDDPLVVEGKVRVLPNVSGQFVKARGDRLVTFLRLYGAPGRQYEAKLLFTKGGRAVVETPATQLPVTDARGQAVFSPVLPLDSFEAGEYAVEVTILEPGKPAPVARETAFFRVT